MSTAGAGSAMLASTPWTPAPVRLTGDLLMGPPAPEASIWPWAWGAIALLGVAIVAAALLTRAWLRIDPAERAFRCLALLLGLRARDRRALRGLSKTTGTPAVAWLLSDSPWETRAASASAPARAGLAALRDRCLGARQISLPAAARNA
ncbi:MAG: hypothetical protein JNK35_14160 [Phycisphaerae bacterium]|nr:hypothetical protein [Phycisphaerae bacterium]